jgi:hypothetical protein
MKFEFEFPDDVVTSVQQWISIQISVYPDPETGLPANQMRFTDVHDFFEKALSDACQQACLQFPSPALREQLVARKQADKLFAASIKPQANRAASVSISPAAPAGSGL